MPYIDSNRRSRIDEAISYLPADMTVGDLNYAVTRILDREITLKGLSYTVCNNIIGTIECAKLELYARIVRPYENKKMVENGDSYDNAGRS